jgi:hypothetical protein
MWPVSYAIIFPANCCLPCKEIYGNIRPCGGGVKYLHRDPASRRRRRKVKSQIWDSKIWPRAPRDLDPRKKSVQETWVERTGPENCLWVIAAGSQPDENWCDLSHNYSTLESVIIICSCDLWLSNKSTHQSKTCLHVTETRKNILGYNSM